MKAYVCSIGEPTTKIVCNQLKKFGFEVVLYGEVEPWHKKYERFIFEARENCIRIDADVVPNINVKVFMTYEAGMKQARTYDMYKNDVGVTSPVFYSKGILKEIRDNWDKIGVSRPETDASRLPSVNPFLYTSDIIVGIHGIYQRQEDIDRHQKHKVLRKQITDYDFELINQLQDIWRKD